MGNSNSASTGTAPAVTSANPGSGSLGWFYPIVPSNDEVKNPGAVEVGNRQTESATITVVVETPTPSSKSVPEIEEPNKVPKADHAYGAPIAEFYLEPGSDTPLTGPFAAFGANTRPGVGKDFTEDPEDDSLNQSHEGSNGGTDSKPIRVHVLVENVDAAGGQNPNRLPEAPVPTKARGRSVPDRHVEEKYYNQPHAHPEQSAGSRENNALEWADRACSRANEDYGPCRFLQNDMYNDDYLKLVEQAAAAALPVVEA